MTPDIPEEAVERKWTIWHCRVHGWVDQTAECRVCSATINPVEVIPAEDAVVLTTKEMEGLLDWTDEAENEPEQYPHLVSARQKLEESLK